MRISKTGCRKILQWALLQDNTMSLEISPLCKGEIIFWEIFCKKIECMSISLS
jgi:hypothetical protein